MGECEGYEEKKAVGKGSGEESGEEEEMGERRGKQSENL